MANFNLSNNMSLPVPVPTIDPGPDWSFNINACLTLLDSHDHSAGKGVLVTPAGMNISSDLNFQGNNAFGLRSSRYSVQSSTLSLPSDVGCVYVSGVDLYYNDVNGNPIRMTQSGGVAGTPGSITGLASPASATYVPLSSTFVWQSNVNTPANMDAGSYIFRNITANSKGVTVQAPAALATNYNLTLPLLPSVQSFMTLDNAGNISAPWTVDGVTIKVTSNQLVAQQNALDTEHHSWELNGAYSSLTFPLLNIDAIFFAPYNLTITSVWIYNGTAGASGTTEYDLKVASPGGSFTTILTTTGKITSAAASTIWTDSGSIVGTQTGVTKPVIGTANITAGQAIKFDLIQSMASPATDARIRIYYKPT